MYFREKNNKNNEYEFGNFQTMINKYGNINDLDVINIKNMSNLFHGKNLTDENLGNWEVGNVINMEYMFNNCKNFKGNGLNRWDVSKVRNMFKMFIGCNAINVDNILNWNFNNRSVLDHVLVNGTNNLLTKEYYPFYNT